MKCTDTNQLFKKLMAALIAAAFCITASGAFLSAPEPAYAEAAGTPVKYASKLNVMYHPDDLPYYAINMSKKVKKPTGIKVTSSNTSVVKSTKYSSKKIAVVKVRKPGKATLKIKVKTKKKTKTFKCKLTVLPYESPFQSLKIGSLDLTSNLDQSPYASFTIDKTLTGPLNLSLKDGWELVWIKYSKYYIGDDYEYDGSDDIDEQGIQNGATVTLYPEADDAEWIAYVDIKVKNPALGITSVFNLTPDYIY